MPKIKDFLPSILIKNNNSKKIKENNNVGRLESDAQPVSDDDNGNSNNEAGGELNSIVSPTVSTELTESVVRELSNPNYNSATGAVMESNENSMVDSAATTNNTMNVQHQQQNIVMQFSNANNLHFGSVYNFNSNITTSASKDFGDNDLKSSSVSNNTKRADGKPRKTMTIVTMMQSQAEPDHRMLDTIATHLGKGWKQVMRDLGHSEGQIEQAIIDHQMHGDLKEVIYQLLLQWIRGADDNMATLGVITTLLWESNQRECVQRMKLVYKAETNRKKSS